MLPISSDKLNMWKTVPTLVLLCLVPFIDIISSLKNFNHWQYILKIILCLMCLKTSESSFDLYSLLFALGVYITLLLVAISRKSLLGYQNNKRIAESVTSIPSYTNLKRPQIHTSLSNEITSTLVKPHTFDIPSYGTMSPKSIFSPEALLFKVEDLLSPYLDIPSRHYTNKSIHPDKAQYIADVMSIDSEESIDSQTEEESSSSPSDMSPLKAMSKCAQTAPIMATLLALSAPASVQALPLHMELVGNSDSNIRILANFMILLLLNLLDLYNIHEAKRPANAIIVKTLANVIAWSLSLLISVLDTEDTLITPILFSNCYLIAFQTLIILLSFALCLIKIISQYRLARTNEIFKQKLKLHLNNAQ